MGTKRRPEDGKYKLQHRVAELETALLSISQKLEATPRTIESDDGAAKSLQQSVSGNLLSTPVVSLSPDPEASLEHAPVLSLFDNAILSRRPDDGSNFCGQDPSGTRSPQSDVNNDLNPKFENIRRTLLSLFPSQQREKAILNVSHTWWRSWQDLFPQMFGPGTLSNFHQYVAHMKASGSVQKIAKTLLCLFTIVQEGHANANTGYVTNDAGDRLNMALGIIDDKVLGDDELAGTIDGVECMVLRAKYHTNDGRIRKSWLTFRRAISFAHLLGLHKSRGPSNLDANESLRRESVWKAVYSADRFLSLLLGLPYGPSEEHSDVGRDSEMSAKGIQTQSTGEHYMFRLSNVIGHIIDRNQQLPSNNMLPLTFKIEAEMTELAASMSSDWWESGRQQGAEASQMYSQLIPQFLHYQARTLLHLPFMLKAATDRRFEYNKIATLESAREMIMRYRVIRPVQGFGSLVCRMIDFQVFTAVMILILNLFDHYRKSEALDHREAEQDQDLVTGTTEMLQRASFETHGSVATQAARALEMFGNIRDLVPLVCECSTKVVIPYFGAVMIGPGASFRDRGPVHQPEQLPTPSDKSLDSSTPGSEPFSNSSTSPLMPSDLNLSQGAPDIAMNGDVFAEVNFDLDQDWNWFWDNIDIPSVDLQGTIA